jgi:hypothetical protein
VGLSDCSRVWYWGAGGGVFSRSAGAGWLVQPADATAAMIAAAIESVASARMATSSCDPVRAGPERSEYRLCPEVRLRDVHAAAALHTLGR